MIGRTLSHFEITASLGAGGMGEVYRATDTRLRREVAIKVLPALRQGDEGLRQRLSHEAESISQLQHPNICALYDIGRENGVDFLVMELLEGETLEERLGRGPLPVPEALAVAAQIASALERAHRHGIVHRDLKPGNVMLTADGAKVLDFGLAKDFPGGGLQADTASPTVLMTDENVIVGTMHYMAPEQLHGKKVDARTDIFALGCVLHEMISGQRPFDGDSRASLIAAILDHQPPPLDHLEIDSPPGLGRVVERCLAKDPEHRWHSSGDVRFLLEDVADGEFSGEPPRTPTARSRGAVVGTLVAAAGLVVAAWIVGGSGERRPSAPAARIERHQVDEVGDAVLGELSNPVLSPDGEKVAFVASSDVGLQIYLRHLDELAAAPVEGTANAGWMTFDPDSERLLFFDVVDRSLKQVSIHGGTSTEVVRPSYLPAAWGTDGYIYYTPAAITSRGTPDDKGLWRVPAGGGDGEQLTRAEPIRGTGRHRGHYSPRLLPDRRKLLFSVGDGYLHSGFDTAVLDLDTGDWDIVVEGTHQARFVDDHLVFWRDRRLWAAPFDPARMEALATPQPVLDGVAQHPLAPVEVGQFDVTAGGDLVYLSGGSSSEEISRLTLTRFDGEEVELVSNQNERIFGPTLAAGGRHLAFDRCFRFNSADRDCRAWTLNLKSRELVPVGPEQRTTAPLWEASGEALIYTEIDNDQDRRKILRRPLDGGPISILVERPAATALAAAASHPDGRLIYTAGAMREVEIQVRLPDGSEEVLVEGARQMVTDLSPDGRWLVYHSQRSGQFELYTLDLAAKDTRPRQITSEGALFGHFAPDGRSLYLRSRTYPGPAEILRAPFDPSTGVLGEAELVMETAAQGYTSSWWLLGLFDVSDDAFVLAELRTPPRSGRIVLVRNWAAEIADRLR